MERPDDRFARRDLAVLLTAAWCLRVGVALAWPNQQHADEVYEYVEQAYRVVTGGGLVPWEFQYAARSWLLASALVPIVWFASLSAFTRAHLHDIVGATLAIVTLTPVAAAYLWTHRVAGRRAAWIAGAFAAVWFDLVYVAAKPTQEVVGGACLVLGLLWLSSPGEPLRHRLAGGVALGLAIAFRLQLAPAVALAIWLACRRQPSSTWGAVAGGTILGFLAGGLADWIGWSYPFEGYVRYAIVTTKGGMASWYGVKPFYYYASQTVFSYSIVALPFAIATVAAARRYPAPFLIALAIVITHSLIPHKEYRFIVPAMMTLVPLAGVGVGLAFEWLTVRATVGAPGLLAPGDRVSVGAPGLLAPGTLSALAVLVCIATSVALAAAPRNRTSWTHRSAHIAAFRDVSREADACGVGIAPGTWSMFPGESGMARPVPIFESDVASGAGSYNYAITVGGQSPPAGFRPLKRYWTTVPDDRSEQVDLYKRDGGCDATQAPLRLLPIPEAVSVLWGDR